MQNFKLKFTSPIVFPRDEGFHQEASDEWWYFNCYLTSQDGTKYAAVVCFFPTYLLSMLADVSNKRMLHNSIVVNEKFHSSNQKMDIRFGHSWWRQTSDSPPSYTMHCDVGKFLSDLEMKALKQPMLVDGTGQIREGLLGRSYYYARTRLQVEGLIKVDDKDLVVTGSGWIDRQWGDWDWSGIGTWEWFSVQLNNNVEMLIIQITNPLTGGVVSQSFSVSDGEGRTRVLKSFCVKHTRRWTSPQSNQSYACGWIVESPGHCNLHVLPVFNAQEAMHGLWEGVCEVRGSYEGLEVRGRAYVEQSHGRIYGSKRKKFIFLTVGLISHVLRRINPGGANLAGKLVKVLYIMRI